MTDPPGPAHPRRPRRRILLAVAGAFALAGIVLAGVYAAGGTGPARANLPPAGSEPAQAAAAAAPAAATRTAARPARTTPRDEPRLKGQGPPIRISGTDPVTGRPVSLDRLTGKPVVLAIWASWCPGCNDEGPHLARVAARRTDVHFVGVNYRDDAGGARSFYSRYGWRFPSIEDPSGEISFRLGLQGTPTTILLDSDHREIGRIVGPTDAAGFEEAVDRITAS